MKTTLTLIAVASFASTIAVAAPKEKAPALPKKYVTVDYSTELLLDKDAAKTIWVEEIPGKVTKMYSPKKWALATNLEGGFNAGKTCVLVARVVQLPQGVNGKTMLYKPEKTTSTFDALSAATKEQCADLARIKLKEAIHAKIVAMGD